MAMRSGTDGSVWIDANNGTPGGGTPAALIKVTKWEYSGTVDKLTATNLDSAGRKEYIKGNADATISISGRWDTAEAKLFGARTATTPVVSEGIEVDFDLYIDKTDLPNESFIGSGFIESFKVGVDQGTGEAMTYDLVIQPTGAVTPPAAA